MDLCEDGWVLRSGGAQGADSAFERGCDIVGGKKEIFLPWKEFNNNPSFRFNIPREAYDLALQYHPNPVWLKQSNHVIRLMARNMQQIFGHNLDVNTRFVVCWTQDGTEKVTTAKTGGTGQAIRAAVSNGIPVFNLMRSGAVERMLEFLEGLENVNEG